MSASVPEVWPVSGEAKAEHGLVPPQPSAPLRVREWPPRACIVPTERRWPGEREALAGLSLPGH